jgi:hypothetical protein
MKKLIAAVLCLALFGSAGWAADDPVPVLKKGDVERFIDSFPKLAKELEKLGMKYDAEEGDYSLPEAVQANAEFNAVLKKHGWDEKFFIKMQAIFLGYTAIVYKKEMANVAPEIAKAIKEIESAPGMSEAMKKQMIERMKASQKMMEGSQSGMQTSVHEDDLALIRPKIPDLKKLFEHDD